MSQYNLSIDLNDGTAVDTGIVFKYDVEAAIKQATSITIQHFGNYSAVSAFYDSTQSRLYPVAAMANYWTVDGNTMTYT